MGGFAGLVGLGALASAIGEAMTLAARKAVMARVLRYCILAEGVEVLSACEGLCWVLVELSEVRVVLLLDGEEKGGMEVVI